VTWSRRLAPVLILVVAAACLPGAYYGMFSGFRDYDDEGYLLISLRDYSRHGILYDQVYTQYGPAYYQLLTAVFSLLGLDFTHSAGRAFVLALWVVVPALCAFTTYRLTRNLAVTLSTQLLVFLVLIPMRNEPPHPGGPLALLISAVALAGTFLESRGRLVVIALIGVALGAGTLMKVNVGLFGVVSVLFVLILAARPGPYRGLTRLAAGVGLVLTPIALMINLAAMPPVRALLMVGALAALGVVLMAWTNSPRMFGMRDLALFLAAFVTTIAVSSAWELARGTTPGALLRGVVLAPLDQPAIILLLLPVATAAVTWALAAVVFVALLTVARRRGWLARPLGAGLFGIGQILAGLFIWLVADERLPVGPLAPWPLLGLALAPPPDRLPERQGATLFVVSLALLQALHVYPVAGSQVAWATFLFIPVGGVLLVRGWRTVVDAGLSRWRLVGPVLGLATVVLTTLSALSSGALLRSTYEAGVALGLPGAESIRVRPRDAERYRLLSRALARCTTFVTFPGLNSLYLFSRVEAPTMMNTTSWVTLLSPAQQREIAERLSRMPDPVCAVRIRERDGALHRFDTPLTRYIRDEFFTVFTVDDYAFMERGQIARTGPGSR
jgi:hypothetical protein